MPCDDPWDYVILAIYGDYENVFDEHTKTMAHVPHELIRRTFYK